MYHERKKTMSVGDQTIVAVSSPPGRSRRGLIRIAGPRSGAILSELVEPRDSLSPQRVAAGWLWSPRLPVLVAWFARPHSYTGEDLAEIQLPGHPALLERLTQQAITRGARLAEAGEFTFRAFAAGKLDLTQAEGVAATIAASSDAQLQAAGMLRQGQLGRFAQAQVDALASALALVEAGIDFVDQEDVVPITPGQLAERLAQIAKPLDQMLKRSRSWQSLEALPRVVLVGPPSAGKSTLFNALLGRTRAVVHAQPGTTRDVLSEPMVLHGSGGQAIEVMLVDIAGLDVPTAALDEQVQAAARQAIGQADVVVVLQPPSTGGTRGDWQDVAGRKAKRIDVIAKVDLLEAGADLSTGLPVSAMTGQGLDALGHAIAEAIGSHASGITSEMLALQPRHEAAIRAALDAVHEARSPVLIQRAEAALARPEVIAQAMRTALDELAGLGGQMTRDDVIGRIFSTFCVGK